MVLSGGNLWPFLPTNTLSNNWLLPSYTLSHTLLKSRGYSQHWIEYSHPVETIYQLICLKSWRSYIIIILISYMRRRGKLESQHTNSTPICTPACSQAVTLTLQNPITWVREEMSQKSQSSCGWTIPTWKSCGMVKKGTKQGEAKERSSSGPSHSCLFWKAYGIWKWLLN